MREKLKLAFRRLSIIQTFLVIFSGIMLSYFVMILQESSNFDLPNFSQFFDFFIHIIPVIVLGQFIPVCIVRLLLLLMPKPKFIIYVLASLFSNFWLMFILVRTFLSLSSMFVHISKADFNIMILLIIPSIWGLFWFYRSDKKSYQRFCAAPDIAAS